VKVSRISSFSDDKFSFVTKIIPDEHIKNSLDDFQINTYIASMYDKNWYLGIILDVSHEFDDVLVNFMHPPGPAHSFKWPNRPDKCWIPITDVLCKIDCPSTATGRQYVHMKWNKKFKFHWNFE
jgi:hypothetical protein